MPFLRRLRISLRTSMLVVLVVAAWLGWITHRARQQWDAVAAIREYGGSVRYDYEFVDGIPTPGREPAAPKWLRRILGDEFFREVVEVNLINGHIRKGRSRPRLMTEGILAPLRELPHLKTLWIGREQ